MKSDCVEICSHCRPSLKVRFREFENVSFYFHWVGDVYCIDVMLVLASEDFVTSLFCLMYGLEK